MNASVELRPLVYFLACIVEACLHFTRFPYRSAESASRAVKSRDSSMTRVVVIWQSRLRVQARLLFGS